MQTKTKKRAKSTFPPSFIAFRPTEDDKKYLIAISERLGIKRISDLIRNSLKVNAKEEVK